jgi:hypothetical protein
MKTKIKTPVLVQKINVVSELRKVAAGKPTKCFGGVQSLALAAAALLEGPTG